MALDIFRHASLHALKLRDSLSGEITHSGVAAMPIEASHPLLQTICKDDYARKFLSSLTLLDDLPGKKLWMEFLTGSEDQASWDVLAKATAFTMDHQSQESTDCRWLKILFTSLKGQLHFPAASSGSEMVEEIRNYPNHGDMRKVRPLIRATEGALHLTSDHSDWSNRFWVQCLRDTGCSPLPVTAENQLLAATSLERLASVYDALVAHANKTRSTSDVDPRHDMVFGTGLFALTVLRELLQIGVGQTVLGRTALRTLLESLVSLSYLAFKDSRELWKSFRVYGAGQAKLAFLKLDAVCFKTQIC